MAPRLPFAILLSANALQDGSATGNSVKLLSNYKLLW
jgi:hypothetical protein